MDLEAIVKAATDLSNSKYELQDVFPPFRLITVSLLEFPTFSFDVKVAKSISVQDVASVIPGFNLMSFIDYQARIAMSKLLWPFQESIHAFKGEQIKLGAIKLIVEVVSARHLQNVELVGKSGKLWVVF